VDPLVFEIRVGWALLTFLALLIELPVGSVFLGMWALATAPGWWVLANDTRAAVLLRALRAALSARAARIAAIVLTALLAFATFVFGAAGALWLLSLLLSLIFVRALRAGASGAGSLLEGAAIAGATFAIVLTAVELTLRSEQVGRKLGTPQERAAWAQRYDRLWDSNIFGFRSRHERVARRPGVRRVLVLGDSYTWGDKIASSDSIWSAEVERTLSADPHLGPVEVINMAHLGWSLANEAELLRRLGWQFDPDLVVIQFLGNDAQPSSPNFGTRLPPTLTIVPARFRQGALANSALLHLLEWRFASTVDFAATHFHPDSTGWKQLRQALQEIGDSAQRRRVPVLLVQFPWFRAGGANLPVARHYARVAQAAWNAGILVLDLTPAYAAQGAGGRRWWATPYDPHPNVAAHHVAAAAIAGEIRARGLLRVKPKVAAGSR
jgi:lysophospholipase L1-like esterase